MEHCHEALTRSPGHWLSCLMAGPGPMLGLSTENKANCGMWLTELCDLRPLFQKHPSAVGHKKVPVFFRTILDEPQF